MRIYIETTIPSYLVSRQNRDILQTANQQVTRDWWRLKRERHDLYVSQVVLDEIALGEREMAQRRFDIVHGIPILGFD